MAHSEPPEVTAVHAASSDTAAAAMSEPMNPKSKVRTPLALTDWGVALAALDLGGAARQLASNCTFVGREGALVKLALDPAHTRVKTGLAPDDFRTNDFDQLHPGMIGQIPALVNQGWSV